MIEPLDTASYARGWVRRARALESRLDARRAELRAQADDIARALKQRWPKARVHLLGSVLDPDTFRMDSDLDLVLEGVSPERYWEAWAVAEPLARGTRLDFIRFESAAPTLRELVRTEGKELWAPADRTGRARRTFLGRIRRHREVVASVHERLVRSVQRIDAEGADDVLTSAAALHLHHLYTAIEDLFSLVATDLDGALPSGPERHRELLEQMTLEISDVRPRLLDDAFVPDLHLLRRFSHRVRRSYGDPLDWADMKPVVEAAERSIAAVLPTIVERLHAAIEAPIEGLERE